MQNQSGAFFAVRYITHGAQAWRQQHSEMTRDVALQHLCLEDFLGLSALTLLLACLVGWIKCASDCLPNLNMVCNDKVCMLFIPTHLSSDEHLCEQFLLQHA